MTIWQLNFWQIKKRFWTSTLISQAFFLSAFIALWFLLAVFSFFYFDLLFIWVIWVFSRLCSCWYSKSFLTSNSSSSLLFSIIYASYSALISLCSWTLWIWYLLPHPSILISQPSSAKSSIDSIYRAKFSYGYSSGPGILIRCIKPY